MSLFQTERQEWREREMAREAILLAGRDPDLRAGALVLCSVALGVPTSLRDQMRAEERLRAARALSRMGDHA